MKIYPTTPVVNYYKCIYDAEDTVSLEEIEDAIRKVMTEYYELPAEQIFCKTKKQPYTFYKFMAWTLMTNLCNPSLPKAKLEGCFGGISLRPNIYHSVWSGEWCYEHFKWYKKDYDAIANKVTSLVSRVTTDGIDEEDLTILKKAQHAHYDNFADYEALQEQVRSQKAKDYVRRMIKHRKDVRKAVK